MNRMLQLFHEYPVIPALGAALMVLLILGLVMVRAGVPIKVLTWFFVFFAIVGVPQATMHVLDALAFHRQQSVTQAAPPSQVSASPGALAPVPWSEIVDIADALAMPDPRTSLSAAVGSAIEARLVAAGASGTVLAARFVDREAALQAFENYGQLFRLRGMDRNASDGWTGMRYGAGPDWVHVVSAGPELYAWTGTRQWVLDQRERVLGAAPENAASESSQAQRAHEARLATRRLTSSPLALSAFVAINLAAAVLWFFWGLAWTTRVAPPHASGPALGAAQLRQNLLNLDHPGVRVSPGPEGSVILDWETDARWFDLMRLHKMRHTHRVVLHLDEQQHRVRVREYMSRFDANAGAGGLRLDWHAATGIQLFRVEQSTAFGVQLDAHGRPTGAFSHTTKLDVQALKQPAIDAVLRAGWSWQPALFHRAPRVLHWLTG